MKNISLNGENISLKTGKSYIVIDGLYINTIKEELNTIEESSLETDIREKIFSFPKTDTPFAVLNVLKKNGIDSITDFSILSIKRANESDEKSKRFDTDTGLLIFIDRVFFGEFINDFDYYKLVDSSIDPVNIDYWNQLYEKYGQSSLALVLAPGMGSGYDFVGSGTYKVELIL
jgi:hypothetical protein